MSYKANFSQRDQIGLEDHQKKKKKIIIIIIIIIIIK